MEIERADGRTVNQLRPLGCSRNVLNRAHGSSSWSQGDTKVLAAVYGPKSGTKKNENPEKACIEVIWRTKSGQNGKAEKEYEMILKRTLQSICVLNVYPNTTTSIIVQVVHDDGALLPCAVNAACAALVDAGIPLKHLAVAICCCVTDSGDVILDPTKLEEQNTKAFAYLVFPNATMSVLDGATLTDSEPKELGVITSVTHGAMAVDDYLNCLERGQAATAKLSEFLRRSFQKQISNDFGVANMEDHCDEKAAIREPLVQNNVREGYARYDKLGSSSLSARNLPVKPSSLRGGFRTMPFIFSYEAFLDVGTYGVMPNMIIYLVKKYGIEAADATQILFLWSASVYSSPSVCALIADSYIGKYWMIAFGSFVSVLGMSLLWLSAMIPQATPCHEDACAPHTLPQIALLYSSLILISLGAGAVRSSTVAFGADQLTTIPSYGIKNERLLEKYFGWFYLFSYFSIMVAMTLMIYIQETWGWRVGFGVAALLSLLSAVSFYSGSALYLKLKAKKGLLSGMAQVVVACYRKRHVSMLSSAHTSGIRYHHKKGSLLITPSDKLRILNKACIVETHERGVVTTEEVQGSWNLCTVEQVEDLKSLIRVIPLWSSGIVVCMTITQTTFITLQALSMDRRVIRNFEIPAASLYMFSLVSLILWIALYDRAIIPFASMIMGKSVRLSTRQRMGVGQVFSFLSMVVAAIVERYRRSMSAPEAHSISTHSVLPVSALWLAPQYSLMGIAMALTAVAQTEFYYSELPKSMASIASTLFAVGLSAGSLASSFLVNIIDNVTGSGGSWVSNDINDGHYDYYYWLLAGLNVLNYGYFLACCHAYGPVKQPEEIILLAEADCKDGEENL